ncbi:hypothetical protein POTOM_013691 [Populus tomentosa]|uniref:Uncharacterized protein n=1 Tax=Populus tomentosa TaxID=118781 RepID=A0A8X8AAH9_POPTO|nr:hypothetical protein POTOM_013691 [Populus tomentosa]
MAPLHWRSGSLFKCSLEDRKEICNDSDCLPLAESALKHSIKDNYRAPLFRPIDLPPSTSGLPAVANVARAHAFPSAVSASCKHRSSSKQLQLQTQQPLQSTYQSYYTQTTHEKQGLLYPNHLQWSMLGTSSAGEDYLPASLPSIPLLEQLQLVSSVHGRGSFHRADIVFWYSNAEVNHLCLEDSVMLAVCNENGVRGCIYLLLRLFSPIHWLFGSAT